MPACLPLDASGIVETADCTICIRDVSVMSCCYYLRDVLVLCLAKSLFYDFIKMKEDKIKFAEDLVKLCCFSNRQL